MPPLDAAPAAILMQARLDLDPVIAALSERLPNLLLAALILAVGWVIALLARRAVSLVLQALGLDVILRRLGLDAYWRVGDASLRPSRIAGTVVYWLVWFGLLYLAFEVAGWETGAAAMQALSTYLPGFLLVLLLLVLGWYIGHYLGDLAAKAAESAHAGYAPLVGTAVRYGVLALIVIALLEELGVASTSVVTLLALVAGIVPVALAIGLGLGLRPVMEELLAGGVVRTRIHAGDEIVIDDVGGTVESIRLVDVVLSVGDAPKQQVAVPHSRLLEATVELKAAGEAPPEPRDHEDAEQVPE